MERNLNMRFTTYSNLIRPVMAILVVFSYFAVTLAVNHGLFLCIGEDGHSQFETEKPTLHTKTSGTIPQISNTRSCTGCDECGHCTDYPITAYTFFHRSAFSKSFSISVAFFHILPGHSIQPLFSNLERNPLKLLYSENQPLPPPFLTEILLI